MREKASLCQSDREKRVLSFQEMRELGLRWGGSSRSRGHLETPSEQFKCDSLGQRVAHGREARGTRMCILAGGQLRIFPTVSRAGQSKAVTHSLPTAVCRPARTATDFSTSRGLFIVLSPGVYAGEFPSHGPWGLYRASVQSIRRGN